MRGGIGGTQATWLPGVVDAQVARLGGVLADGLGEAASRLLGDIFLEAARTADGREDLANGVGSQGAVASSAVEGADDIFGIEAGAKAEDEARLMKIQPRRGLAHELEELGGTLAHALECPAQLVGIGGRAMSRGWVKAVRVELEALSAGGKLMASDAAQIGAVDEQLVLGDAHGQDVGDMVVGHRVAIALPVDEAVDAADSVGDAGSVVVMRRKRP